MIFDALVAMGVMALQWTLAFKKNGIISQLKDKLINLYLHANELSLRHLFSFLNYPTIGLQEENQKSVKT